MSDFLVRVFPSEPTWQPTPEAARAAADLVGSILTAGGNAADDLEVDHYERLTVIDAGENTDSMTCPACGVVSDASFLDRLMEDHPDGLESLDVTVPCCGSTVPLTAVEFDWPIGVARFEICVRNPTRDGQGLSPDELRRVGDALGHEVDQVLAHL